MGARFRPSAPRLSAPPALRAPGPPAPGLARIYRRRRPALTGSRSADLIRHQARRVREVEVE
ncbi:hypothetical protein [Streptomyces sp. NPDC059452]|uniref:hypothetical protein n=1 Tax=Streptomyces sp. NPDC059452 TaxID=3346835 RepID=UPI003685F2A7